MEHFQCCKLKGNSHLSNSSLNALDPQLEYVIIDITFLLKFERFYFLATFKSE